jgi:hypothetical protein
MCSTYEHSMPRLWYPRLTWAWLGIAPRAYIVDEPSTFLNQEEDMTRATTMSYEEAQRGFDHVDDTLRQKMIIRLQTEARKQKKSPLTFSISGLHLLLYRAWNGSRMLRGRLQLSHALRSVYHSRHVLHGLKNAGGVALLSLPALLPSNTRGRFCHIYAAFQYNNKECRKPLVSNCSWPMDDCKLYLGTRNQYRFHMARGLSPTCRLFFIYTGQTA